MIPKQSYNGFSVIRLIDNTKQEAFIPSVYKQGHTEYSRLLSPNMGKIVCSKKFPKNAIIYFNSLGLIKVENDCFCVNEKNIFRLNDMLIKPGVVVKKMAVQQKINGMVYRSQDYFEVVQSNCNIKLGSVVMVLANVATKFYIDTKEFFFVNEVDVFIYVEDEIKPGTEYEFLEVVTESIEYTPIKREIAGQGIKNNNRHLFTSPLSKINVSGKPFWVVKKTDIYGEK